jgi:hypothetical protein
MGGASCGSKETPVSGKAGCCEPMASVAFDGSLLCFIALILSARSD